jgi:hypothetical protein
MKNDSSRRSSLTKMRSTTKAAKDTKENNPAMVGRPIRHRNNLGNLFRVFRAFRG